MEQAIYRVMDFYQISWDDAVKYYWDEVEAYMKLSLKLSGVEE